jgi:hypothetical protein
MGKSDFAEQAVEGAANLNCFLGAERERLVIHAAEGVVHDGAGSADALGDDTGRRQAEPLEELPKNEAVVREDGPIAQAGNVCHLARCGESRPLVLPERGVRLYLNLSLRLVVAS